MQVYSNIVRFPAPAPAPDAVPHRPTVPERRDNVVEFAPDRPDDFATIDLTAQGHGQLHLAHRVSARVAAALDAVAVL
jgi:hypothetical protein